MDVIISAFSLRAPADEVGAGAGVPGAVQRHVHKVFIPQKLRDNPDLDEADICIVQLQDEVVGITPALLGEDVRI